MLCVILVLLGVCGCLFDVDSTYYHKKRQSLFQLTENKPDQQNIKDMDLGYLGVCVVAKNEHAYVREWVQYHLYKGVSKIYFFDHNSKPSMASQLEDFVDQGRVDYYYFSSSFRADDFEFENGPLANLDNVIKLVEFQLWGYHSCLKWFGHRHKFIAFFDVDEFLVLDNLTQTFPEYLKEFEKFGGLKVYRKFFGTSGFQTAPNGSLLEQYTSCFPDDSDSSKAQNPKPIINMKYFGGTCAVHRCKTTRPSVNTEKVEDTGINKKSGKYRRTYKGAQFNHYYAKSFEEFVDKLLRKYGIGDDKRVQYEKIGRQRLDEIEKHSTGVCLEGKQLFKQCCTNITFTLH